MDYKRAEKIYIAKRIKIAQTEGEIDDGYRNVSMLQGGLVRASAPAGIIKPFNATVVKIANDPEVNRRMEDLGYVPVACCPAEYGTFI